MSDSLAVAIWRAKAARQAPRIVNIYDPSEDKLKRLKADMEALLDKNQELTITNRNLRISRERLQQELAVAKQGVANLMKIPHIAANAVPILPEILEATALRFGISIKEIRSDITTRHIAHVRQIAMYLGHKIGKRSYASIGRFFDRDHTTVLNAKEKIERLRQQDQELNSTLAAIEIHFEKLGSMRPSLEPSAPAVAPVAAGAPIGDA